MFVNWDCTCGVRNISFIDALTIEGGASETFTVKCRECFQIVDITISMDIVYTNTYDDERDFE